MCLSFALSLGIGQVYRVTHHGVGYSRSFVQTLVLMGMVTSLIMIVIGSNIARAFSLVGALSIIRFRNAIKETRDVGYIFFAMAIAMACGTRFYSVAIVATLLIAVAMLGLHVAGYGTFRREPERLLRVQLEPGLDPDTVLVPVFETLFQSYRLVLIENVRQGLYVQTVYSVQAKPDLTPSAVIEAVTAVNGNLKVTYNFTAHTDEV
ncbi:MAG: DUF4956 domain-containing protein [Planctomycetes bacterium]|nr:DUF4956 domain-containing protein [Planctomycetota bacterium]